MSNLSPVPFPIAFGALTCMICQANHVGASVAVGRSAYSINSDASWRISITSR